VCTIQVHVLDVGEFPGMQADSWIYMFFVARKFGHIFICLLWLEKIRDVPRKPDMLMSVLGLFQQRLLSWICLIGQYMQKRCELVVWCSVKLAANASAL
jgi:hypothetical protein